jgi:L-ascorbate metabolism protein UlaG (beta-lactamase superfamily)
MEIVWYGLSSFRLTERGNASVVTDPYPDDYGYTHPHPRGDVVTISCDDPTRNCTRAVRGPSRVLDGAGEYEIGGVFVTGVAFANKTSRGTPPIQNRVFVFEYDHVTICHLGALNFVPSQSQVEALGTVNVLLTPVGGKDLLSSAEASELVSMLEPSYVVPMHYHVPPVKLRLPKVDTFLNEMGLTKVESVESLKVTSSSLPDATQVVLLKPAW